MALTLRLAARNVRRNPRRTWLTIGATAFAVFLIVFHIGRNDGNHEKAVEDGVRIHSGHVAVSGAGYRRDLALDHFLTWTPEVDAGLAAVSGIRATAPRVIGFGLLSFDAATQPTVILGVDSGRERVLSTLATRLRQGAFLPGAIPHEVLLGDRLAQNLGVSVGQEVLLYSQAYSGEMAYALYTVAGVLKLPDGDLDRSLAVVSLADAQEFFAYWDRVSEVAILTDRADHAPAVATALRAAMAEIVSEPTEVYTWDELNPELVQLIRFDDIGMYLMIAVLVVVVAFGILNTILMSVLERRREFGIALALGLRPARLFLLILAESLMLAAAGIALGLALAIPAVLWFSIHPIHMGGQVQKTMEFLGVEPIWIWKLEPVKPIATALALLLISGLAALYPALSASRARPADALRSR